MRDDPFRIRDFVPDYDAVMAECAAASDRTRERVRHEADVAYGPGRDDRLDVFHPEACSGGAPVHVFVHGGYWRANRKEDYAFVADPIVAADGIAVVVEYTLMPRARMGVLVDQVRRAVRWVAGNIRERGGDPARISASGHSAGAHLASYLAARGPHEGGFEVLVTSLLLVSGIYDLAPIAASFLQPELQLTEEEVAAWSPTGASPAPHVRLTIAVGGDETEPFHAQASRYALANGIFPRTLAGLDHMTIVRNVGTPGSIGAKFLAGTLNAGRE